MSQTFGLNILETDTLYPSDRNVVTYQGKEYEMKHYATVLDLLEAESLGEYEQDFYKGTPAITKNDYGSGKAYFIGARLEDDFQADFYKSLIENLKIEPILSIEGNPKVSVQGRQINEKRDLVFIMNFSEEEQKIHLKEEVIDLEKEKSLVGELTLSPYEVKIVTSQKK